MQPYSSSTHTTNSNPPARQLEEPSYMRRAYQLVAMIWTPSQTAEQSQTYTYMTSSLQSLYRRISTIFSSSNPFPNGQVVTEENIPALQPFLESRAAIVERAVQRGEAARLLFQFLDDPLKELNLFRSWMGSLRTYLLPSLHECSCINSENFNRFKNSRRADLETRMLRDIENFPKEEKLRYLSLGAGGGLQDFINIGKLMKAGYRNLEIALVDSSFHNDYERDPYILNPRMIKEHRDHFDNQKAQISFLQAAAKEPNIALEITYIPSVNKAQGNFHIIQAIDFDNFEEDFKDLMNSHKLLADRGKMYLAYALFDFVFDQTKCVFQKEHDVDPQALKIFDEIAGHLNEEAGKKAKQELNIAFLSDNEHLTQWRNFLPKLSQHAERISLTLVQHEKRNYFGAPVGKPNDQFEPEGLGKFLTLLCGKPVSVTLIPSYEHLKGPQDIVTTFFLAEMKEKVEPRVQWLKKEHPESAQLFAVEAYNKDRSLNWRGTWKWSASEGAQFFASSQIEFREKINSL